MVRSAPYDRLLNHRRAEYSPMAVSGNQAQQIVVIIDAEGEEVGYVWVLSRQTEGPLKDCWMTDAVIPAEREVQRQLTEHPLWTERLSALSIQPRLELESIARTADGSGVVGAPSPERRVVVGRVDAKRAKYLEHESRSHAPGAVDNDPPAL